ncbi:hypothetical protein S40285_09811 [Stachybotrys chlorohalonatus IBT 40285]|uniref:Uncharacterized protein n=1 Tax=Stachybotrys chlorohalonatus (strain IBT 40285) TaxID=1283841 RepID=A0A084QZ54_STAC4|nr:hypothetical protein S40285_09811 [Stachybotrys chlorohalonata IBT 40285]
MCRLREGIFDHCRPNLACPTCGTIVVIHAAIQVFALDEDLFSAPGSSDSSSRDARDSPGPAARSQEPRRDSRNLNVMQYLVSVPARPPPSGPAPPYGSS